jgi:hypothetical protein
MSDTELGKVLFLLKEISTLYNYDIPGLWTSMKMDIAEILLKVALSTIALSLTLPVSVICMNEIMMCVIKV